MFKFKYNCSETMHLLEAVGSYEDFVKLQLLLLNTRKLPLLCNSNGNKKVGSDFVMHFDVP